MVIRNPNGVLWKFIGAPHMMLKAIKQLTFTG